jgi:hypothetical protein
MTSVHPEENACESFALLTGNPDGVCSPDGRTAAWQMPAAALGARYLDRIARQAGAIGDEDCPTRRAHGYSRLTHGTATAACPTGSQQQDSRRPL